MILTKYDTKLPEWVKNVITTECQYCGAPIASNHDVGPLTERWCSNPLCPEHMSYRIAYIAKHYNIKGFGPATAKQYYSVHKPDSPAQIVSTWFAEKPTESLSTITDLACIKDFGKTTGQKFLDQYGSFEEYFEKAEVVDPILLEHKDELICAQKYFNVRKPFTGSNIYVMATGVIHGYSNRDVFFQNLNELVGDKLHIIQVGARKTNVTCLVKEPDAVDHKKSRIAKECGIPIVTSKEFIHIVLTTYERLGGDIKEAERRLHNANI